MKKKLSFGKWILSFVSVVLVLSMCVSLLAYIVDPYFQFRVRDNSYMLSPTLNGTGLIKNYDYDTLILGSSMTQNFNMDDFRNELNSNPLHVGIGGISVEEIAALIRLAKGVNKAKNYYVCIDLKYFSTEEVESSDFKTPSYLFNDNLISLLRYIFGYETWFRYIPVDIGITMFKKVKKNMPEKLRLSSSIDELGNWGRSFTFSEAETIKNYKTEQFNVSSVNTENLKENMEKHIDRFVSSIDDLDLSDVVFFFPPYSSLYWCEAQNDGYYDEFIYAKQYFIKSISSKNCIIYDFQAADITTDLNNYKDMTHYSPEINGWMVKCFAGEKYITTVENYDEFKNNLIDNTSTFRNKYADLF